jgi:hypothetical protein
MLRAPVARSARNVFRATCIVWSRIPRGSEARAYCAGRRGQRHASRVPHARRSRRSSVAMKARRTCSGTVDNGTFTRRTVCIRPIGFPNRFEHRGRLRRSICLNRCGARTAVETRSSAAHAIHEEHEGKRGGEKLSSGTSGGASSIWRVARVRTKEPSRGGDALRNPIAELQHWKQCSSGSTA